jgi:hypothetical protein
MEGGIGLITVPIDYGMFPSYGLPITVTPMVEWVIGLFGFIDTLFVIQIEQAIERYPYGHPGGVVG